MTFLMWTEMKTGWGREIFFYIFYLICLCFTMCLGSKSTGLMQLQQWYQEHKVRRYTLKLIFLIYDSTKPNIKLSCWIYQTKTHITHIFIKKKYQSIPPYFMSLGGTDFMKVFIDTYQSLGEGSISYIGQKFLILVNF